MNQQAGRGLCIILILMTANVIAAPTNLQELLEQVTNEHNGEQSIFSERELKFKTSRDAQASLLATAVTALKQTETRTAQFQKTYDDQDILIARKQVLLKEKLGALNELDGIIKQIAGELDSIIDHSLVSAQKPGRDAILNTLSSRKELPSLQELEKLWLLAIDEMVESGKVATFNGKIITATGNEVEQEVTRIGVFNAVSQGRFLRNLPETGKLIEPGRQPAGHYQKMAAAITTANNGMVAFPIDPTRGAMLELLVQIPDFKSRIEQGGLVGYVILLIGLLGFLLACERFMVLNATNRQVQKQLNTTTINDNPLGRILRVYDANATVNTTTLDLKLDEAILKELPPLQRGLGTIALLAAIAPLLGLLGTVTGIIETFQAITLYGTGDPRVMSGGIAQALVTTVMGLLVAIPLLLLHSFLAAKSHALIQILDEKSAALVATLAEKGQHV